MPRILRQLPRWVLAVGAVSALAILLVGGAVLASGYTVAASDPINWAAFSAFVNLANAIYTAIIGAVIAFIAWLKGQFRKVFTKLDNWADWQSRWTRAAEANMTKLATDQKASAVACITQHNGPAPGRSDPPEDIVLAWPQQPNMRSSERDTF